MLLNDLNKTKIREAFLAEETNSTSSNKKECDFCLMKGHTSLECRKFAAAKIYARKPRSPRKQTANTANNKQEQFIVVESAANASSCHISSSPLQIDANFDWNTMTPHSHWFRNYMPFRTPIHLANDHIIYLCELWSLHKFCMSQILEPTSFLSCT